MDFLTLFADEMAKSNRKRSMSKDGEDGPTKSPVNKKQKRSKTAVSDDEPNVPEKDDEKKKIRRIHSPQKHDKHSGRKSGHVSSKGLVVEQEEQNDAAKSKETAASKEMLLKLKAAEKERAALQAKMEEQEARLSAQSDTISQLHSQCACTVCLELAYRPHVLSPCGHVFCARCLVLWFKKALPDEGPLAPYLTEEQRTEEQQRRTLRRKKLCPHCRVRVQARPAEVWMIKGLVDKLDESIRSGQGNDEDTNLSNNNSVSVAELKEARGENLKAGSALWDTIFPHNDKPYQQPIFDEEDHVYRCGMCASEIVNRMCTNPFCAIEYDENELEDIEDDDSEFDIHGLIYGGDFGVSDEEEWEEEDHDFIDDGPVEINDDSEDEVEYDPYLRQGAREEEEGEENGDVQLVAINGQNVLPRRRRGRVIALSDSEEDEGNRRARSPSNEHFSDRDEGMAGRDLHDDDDDDEQSDVRSEISYEDMEYYGSDSGDEGEQDHEEEFDDDEEEGDPEEDGYDLD